MNTFPRAALLPKAETHADLFLQKYPERDGRGVKVAVFDTGVDPGAIGLQTTTTGQPKLLDLIDCTGSGDVKLTSIPEEKVVLNAADAIYELDGLSGRKLKVPTAWVKCEGTWHLGLKRVYELWPKDLTARITAERKELFLQKHHAYESQVVSQLSEAESVTKPTDEQIEEKKELEARLKSLKTLQDEYKDDGPVFDCIVYKPKVETELDQTSPVTLPWAVIDTTETGDTASLKPMHAYSHAQEYGIFSEASLMSYTFNFYEDVLSINVVSGTHGTHVAGIVAAHHPQDPVLNGVAPGAQIVSMKIGDTRLGSMETSQSFMRAMNEAIKIGVDVINISYGEDSHIANDGPLMNYMRDKVIRKHRITVVSSAGNNGPGYSTIGAPGGMTSSIISVGAYVSKEMAKAMYALRDEAGDSPYTWSSRGPSIDGDKGVTIFAPGGAITCVPPYALNQTQLMNGTSMSSPNAAGGVALLISGLLAEGAPYSPGAISRSLERTAADIHDEFKVGLLDVPAAFDDLVAGDGVEVDMYFDIKVNGDKHKRGILMRDHHDLQSPQVYNVEIKPYFDELATRKKFDFEVLLNLKCKDSFVDVAEFVHLNNTGRALQVKIDPTTVAAGMTVTLIEAYSNVSGKVLFQIPITIVKPTLIDYEKRTKFVMKLAPGSIERQFLSIPPGIEGCSLTVKADGITTPVQLMSALTQFLPNTRRTLTSESFVLLLTNSTESERPVKKFKLVEGTVEFCFAQFWSSTSSQPGELTVELDFHGLSGNYGDSLSIPGGTGYKQIQIKSAVGRETLKPAVRLEMLRKHLRPSKASITPLGSRDVLEDSIGLYSMILQYSITFARAGESQIVLPTAGTLYESPWYSTLVQVFDDKKNLVYFGSAYLEKHTFEKKKPYTVRVELVHRDREVLGKLKDQLISVDSKLEKEITLDLYDSFLEIYTGPKAEFKTSTLPRGHMRSLAISTTTELPKEASFGDLLVGAISLSNHAPLKRPVYYSVPPSAIAKKEDQPSPRTIELQLDMGDKISDKEEKLDHFASLAKMHPTDLSVLGAHLENCRPEDQEYIANSIIHLVDADALANHFGTTAHLPETDLTKAQRATRKEMTRSKTLLAKAYAIKTLKSSDPGVVQHLLTWSDEKSPTFQLTMAQSFLTRGLFGQALVKAQEALHNDDAAADLKEEQIDLLRRVVQDALVGLHWVAWVEKVKHDRIGRDPAEFRGF